MAQRASGFARVANDRYETPPEVAASIVDYLRPRARHVWEPASSPADRFALGLRAAGFTVTSTGGDFLSHCALPDPSIEGIATNPPYGSQGALACAFVRHALALSVRHVTFLLPIDFDSAITRAPLFRNCPVFAGKIVLLGRVRWFEGESTPSTNHAWYLWDQGQYGPPTLRYVRVR